MSKRKAADADLDIGIDVDLAGDDGEPTGEDTASKSDDRPRQDSRPVCPKHGKQMIAYSSNAMYTYYRCPVDGCIERAKRVRPAGPLADLYGNGKSGK